MEALLPYAVPIFMVVAFLINWALGWLDPPINWDLQRARDWQARDIELNYPRQTEPPPGWKPPED